MTLSGLSLDYPNQDVLESTIIGTGGGYGESIVVHLKNNDWIVVDSCVDPVTKNSLPLEYLNQLGVKTNEDVKLIVCTHWHEDHTRGLSQLVESCTSAKFVYANCTDQKKFLRFIGIDYLKEEKERISSSTYEFNKCLEVIRARRGEIKLAEEDKILLGSTSNSPYGIYALSPSSQVLLDFNHELGELITEFATSERKIPRQSPNDKSVV